MQKITEQQRTALEMTTRMLRARERGLQHLAQSTRCTKRPEAELELGKVRAQLADTYSQLRHAQPDGSAGPRSSR